MTECEGVIENRELLTEFLSENQLVATNTIFQKQAEKLITYKNDKSHPGGPPYTHNKFDTLDFVLAPQRWRTSVQDVESQMTSGVNSDHYPLVVEIRVKLKLKKPQAQKRWE